MAKQNKKIVGVITARGGSESVSGKNVGLLKGKPLIAYSVIQAKQSRLLDRVVVSTDDEQIAAVAKKYGVEVQARPPALARNDTPHLPVLRYVVESLEKGGYKPDIVVLLQPTSPFRADGEIDCAIKAFLENSRMDSLVSVSVVPKHLNPLWVKRIEGGLLLPFSGGTKIEDDKRYPRKQELPECYWKNGCIYIMKYSTLMVKNSLFGDFCLPFVSRIPAMVNVDGKTDFALAEFFLDYFGLDVGQNEKNQDH